MPQLSDDFERRLAQVLRTFEPEAIHDLRVSSRRLREGLALFTPCYPPGATDRLSKSIRSVTRLLGEIRNSDEATLFFAGLLDKLAEPGRSELDRLLKAYRRCRKNRVRSLRNGLKKISAGQLRDQFHNVVDSPCLFTSTADGVDTFAPLTGFAHDAIFLRLALIMQLLPATRQRDNYVARHQLRIAVKHCRYRLELLAFMLGSSYPKINTTLRQYQDLLGKMHDLDVFSAVNDEACFSRPTTAKIQELIAMQREILFSEFSIMLANKPFEEICEITIQKKGSCNV